MDNLPIVAPEKYEKLEGVVRKIFGQIGYIREGGLWMPTDEETGKTKGFAFIEYSSPQVCRASPTNWCPTEILRGLLSAALLVVLVPSVSYGAASRKLKLRESKQMATSSTNRTSSQSICLMILTSS